MQDRENNEAQSVERAHQVLMICGNWCSRGGNCSLVFGTWLTPVDSYNVFYFYLFGLKVYSKFINITFD